MRRRPCDAHAGSGRREAKVGEDTFVGSRRECWPRVEEPDLCEASRRTCCVRYGCGESEGEVCHHVFPRARAGRRVASPRTAACDISIWIQASQPPKHHQQQMFVNFVRWG
jgi:hypothetical protein